MPHPPRVRPFVMLAVALLLVATPLAALAAESITWAVKAPMPTPRLGLCVVAQGGDIYAIGGYNGDRLATVERYTPATDSWQSRASLPQALVGPAAVAASDGRIYVFGGLGPAPDPVDNVYYYTPADDLWSFGEIDMPTARVWVTAAEVDGKVYVIGGRNQTWNYTGVNEVFDLADGTWSTGADLPEPRAYVRSVTVGTKVYVIGGWTGIHGSFDRVDIYDTVTDTWSQGAPMPIAADSFGIALVNNRIYAIGGYHATQDTVILNNVQEYDIATNTWSQANPISVPRAVLGAAVVGGKIYAIGGYEDEELGQAQVGTSPARRGLISAEGVQAQAHLGLNEEGTFTQAPPPEVPEPATIMLLASGLLGLGGYGLRGRGHK